ncbi:pentatricopeptide repeat protein [Grosmannia clavigera kw1407]|uniref:Pentatricopeptide repeat protein n=1 Tax=Grosmannia clavigera (strain kw1407 / UAMH 11150) TaxID=655863 RepID=F0XGC9_GROCL|nr:pentatricopeptide repeat protein [Grosmannia clavigera kw1407]EFX03203.1 pentatricopeptide repeat protein [Grosmannia clavigera kw1407]
MFEEVAHAALHIPSGSAGFLQPSADCEFNRELEGDASEASSTLSAAASSRVDAISKRRLQFLRDPYTIGKHVEGILQKDARDGFEKALSITRLASKDKQVTVSWNHLIGYLMRKGKLVAAVKLFNEMKKRAQLPNAQTYTIIFKGCAQSPHASLAVYQATRLYYSMLDNERIKPNTIHMNAVLQVCARAKDVESLFSVAKTANDRLRMPNNLTYTTVFNGLRYSTALPHHRTVKEGEEEVHVDKEKVSVSIKRARAVWEEVVTNWRQGRIIIDEELVCAMGRVLLMGDYHDNDDVLSLVEQTMGIPRFDRPTMLAATPKTAPKEPAATPISSTDEKAVAEDKTAAEDTAAKRPPSEGRKPPPPVAVAHKTQFVPLPAGVIGSKNHNSIEGSEGGSSRILYSQPGRNVLSLVLTSLGATRKTSLAARYWEVFQSPPYYVVPDSENWFRLLKALRRGHNSAKTAELLQKMPKELINERTLQLAMATCAADNLNDGAFASAGKVLDLMSRTLLVPDPHTMRMYLQTAITNNRQFKEVADPREREVAKFAFGRQIVRALGRLWDPLRLAGNALTYPEQPYASGPEKREQTYNGRRELVSLIRQMVSAADMVVSEGMADEATIKDVRTSRNLLNRQVTRFYENREEMEPNLKSARERRERRASFPRARTTKGFATARRNAGEQLLFEDAFVSNRTRPKRVNPQQIAAMAKVASDFEKMIHADRNRKKNEALAARIFNKDRRSSAPIKATGSGAGAGLLTSRAGVKKSDLAAGPAAPSDRQGSSPDNGGGGTGSAATRRAAVNEPLVVMAQNFAPGTTAADIESAMTPVGGLVSSCRILKTAPLVIAEIVFETREGALRVIETFNNQTADGRLLHVYPKAGQQMAMGASSSSQPAMAVPRALAVANSNGSSSNGLVVDGSLGFDDPMDTDGLSSSKLYSDDLVGSKPPTGPAAGANVQTLSFRPLPIRALATHFARRHYTTENSKQQIYRGEAMANDEINVPSLVLILVVSGLLLRHFFFRGPAPSSAAGGAAAATRTSSRQPSTLQDQRRAEALDRRTEAAVDQIQQIFPTADRRAIWWDLRRGNLNVAATTERILAGRLETPPVSFQPPARPTPPATGAAAGNSSSSSSSSGAAIIASRGSSSSSSALALSRSTQPNLIQRYHLQDRVASTDTPDVITPPPSPLPNTVAPAGNSKSKSWSSNKDERQALLKKRRDDMILEARRKMEAKLAAERAATAGQRS